MRRIPFFSLVLFLAAASCGNEAFSLVDGQDVDGGTVPETDAGSDSEVGDSLPMVQIHICARNDPFDHGDAYAGQTPIDQRLGILALELRTGPGDTASLVVFDHGTDYVEVGLNDGDNTLVASVPASGLRGGAYSHARVKVSHVRYRVRSTMHAYGTTIEGQFNNVQVLTDGMFVDGVVRDSGWFRFAFEVGGQTYGTREGMGGPLPETASSGGIGLEVADGEAAYVFAADVSVDPDAPMDTKIVFELNMHESFRWEDLAEPGYGVGAFDTTATSFEPVKRFGANSFSVGAEG